MPRVISYNIAYTSGIDGSYLDYIKFWRYIFPSKKFDADIIDLLTEQKPDILGLIEVDSGSFRSGMKSEGKLFGKKLDYKSVLEVCKYDPKSMMGFLSKLPVTRFQSNALLSRYELYDIKYHWLSKGMKRVVIEASFDCPCKVTLLVVHLAIGKGVRKKQLDELIDIIKRLKNPFILMGDFNTFNGHAELHDLIARTDLVRGPTLKSPPTYPSCKPQDVLDYILTTDDIEVTNYEVIPADFSDHMPVLMDFELKRR